MKKLFQPEIIFCVFLVFLSGFFAFIVPPFQKPDEPAHFLKAMALANGQVACTHSGAQSYFVLSDTVVNFSRAMYTGDIVMRYDAKFPVSLLKKSYPFRFDHSKNTSFSYCSLPALGYIPYAVSAWISSPFDNLLVTFYGMRAAALLVFLSCFFISLALIPSSYRILLFLFAATPMVVHQATAVSYDAASMSLVMVILSLFIRYRKEKHVSIVQLIIFTLLVGMLMVIKGGYYTLCLPLLFLLVKRKRFLIILSVGIVVVLSLRFSVLDILRYIGADPVYFFRVLSTTLSMNIGDYLMGFVGKFGWLDYSVSPLFYVLYFMVLGVVAVKLVLRKVRLLTVTEAVLFLVGISVNILLIFYHFYRAATPAQYYTIAGMQGRYLLPFFPFVLLSVISLVNGIGIRRIVRYMVIIGSVVVLWSFGQSIYNRYYDYSRTFSNPRYFETLIDTGKIPLTTTQAIVINHEMSFVYPVSVGRKIGGFQMLMTNELSVTTPYRYQLKDATCTKILREGYLDALKDTRLGFLKGEKDIVYTQYTGIISVTEDALCVTLRPILQRIDTTYLSLYEEDQKPTFEFLYIAK